MTFRKRNYILGHHFEMKQVLDVRVGDIGLFKHGACKSTGSMVQGGYRYGASCLPKWECTLKMVGSK